jgi:hypothetical protein
MPIYYSLSNNAFYDTDFVTYDLPLDAIVVTSDERTSLVSAIANNSSISVSNGTFTITAISSISSSIITSITPLQFQARFEVSEWSNILTAATQDPNVLGLVFQAAAARTIDLTNPTLVAGLQYLSTRTPSILDSSRIPIILATSTISPSIVMASNPTKKKK